jgi:hypothetical protein
MKHYSSTALNVPLLNHTPQNVEVYVGIVSVNYLDPFIFGAKIPIRLLSCYTIINR